MAEPAHRGSPIKGEVSIEEPARWQSAVARRSAEARAVVPDLDFSVEVDAGPALAAVSRGSCSLTALLLRACALALREHPQANASYRDGRFERYDRVNVGVLLAGPDLYAIPTVFDADRRSAAELTDELEDLARRAATGTLLAPELSGATFTLSDLGPLGVGSATPVIVPPQAAAAGAGAVRRVPIVRNGDIVPGDVITITLSTDHRILYGAAAGAFLQTIKTRLEEAAL
jgi:pyruvate dehydrogenase E2 component (dihydrolipoamide acetyltransferase)